MKMERSGVQWFTAVVLFVVLSGGAIAVEPREVEDEIKVRMLAGAASNIHLRNAPPERVAAWREGARQGDPACQWLLGRCYLYGFTVARDPVEAAAWFRKAADQGYARAELSLGLLMAAGRGVPKDLDSAVRLYQKAADQPDCPEAYEWLIQAYMRGYSVPRDPARVKELARKALSAYQKRADMGYAVAQMRLARIYTTGAWGTPIDIEKGLALYREGLAQGHVYCQTNLGETYVRGEYGLPRDVALGVKYIRLAVAQGDPISRRNLTEMYLDGAVPDPDRAESERLFKEELPLFETEAVEDPAAMYRLAQMNEQGSGVPKDDPRAVALYRKAAESGSAPAARALADRYDAGRGVPKDPARAAELRARASRKAAP